MVEETAKRTRSQDIEIHKAMTHLYMALRIEKAMQSDNDNALPDLGYKASRFADEVTASLLEDI